MKKEINKYSWENITISTYFKILDILSDESLSEIDKQVSLVSLIEGITEDEVLNMPIQEAGNRFSKLIFLNSFNLIPNYKPKKIKIGELELKVIEDTGSISTGQFIDYQAWVVKPFNESMDKLLSIFLIPVGKKYNDGYDLIEVQNTIRECMTFREAQSLLNFILAKYLKLFRTSLRYLVKQIEKTEQGEILLNQINQLEKEMLNLIVIPGYVSSKG